MRIVAVGGAGNAGRAITGLLGPFLNAADHLVLAGRDLQRLDHAASMIETPATISTARLELPDAARTAKVIAGADAVVVTASRPDLIGELADKAIEAGADWIDTLLSTPSKSATLAARAAKITAARRCFVTDGGFHPGLPAVLVHWAGEQYDQLLQADVMAGLRADWRADSLSDSTVEEMLSEFTDFDLTTWIDGGRHTLRSRQLPRVDFGEPIGRKVVVPMPLAEMDSLPERYPGIQRCGFYISGFSPAMDYLALPVLMGMAKVPAWHRATVRATRWSMAHLASSPEPHRLVLRSQGVGVRDGQIMTSFVAVSHADGYRLTAAPVVACLRRILDGRNRTPGLHRQADFVPPSEFLPDLAELGLDVEMVPAHPVRVVS